MRGRDIGSFVAEAQGKIAEQVALPPGYWLDWGGQFENFAAARQRLMIVVPVCFFLIFLLLFSALGSARDALLVFSAVPLALTGGIVALVAARHAVLDLGRGRLHRALRRRGAQRPGDAELSSSIDRSRASARREAIREGALTRLAAGADDGAGRLARLRADGAGDRHRRRGAEAAGDGGHRRPDQRTLLTLLVLPALYAYFTEEARPKHDVGIAGTSFTSADSGSFRDWGK